MRLINEAVPVFVGYGITVFPKLDGNRLTAKFGPEISIDLERQVKSLLDELKKLQPDWTSHTLVSASKWAVSELRRVHPELDDRAASALEWVYSWWWK